MKKIRENNLFSGFVAVGFGAVIVVVYYYGNHIGQLLVIDSHLASPVWIPTGIAVAAILRWGYGAGPAIFIAVLITSEWQETAILLILANCLIRALEPLACVWLIRGFIPEQYPFGNARNVLIYCALGLLILFFSATLEVGLDLRTNLVQPNFFAETWYTNYLGNYNGIIVVTPFLLTWFNRAELAQYSGKLLELFVLISLVVMISIFIFGGWFPDPGDDYSLDFILFPALLWLAYRFQMVGTTLAVFIISGIAILGTANGHGPFAEGSPFESELVLQNYILVTTVAILFFSAVLKDRDSFESQLIGKEKYYRSLVVDSTEGIWRISLSRPISCKLDPQRQVELFFEHAVLSEVNDAAARKWGFESGALLVGTRFNELWPGNELQNRRAIQNFIVTGYKGRDLRVTGMGPDQSLRQYAAHVTGQIEQDRLVGVWAIAAESSDRVYLNKSQSKSREQELRLVQSNKMVALNSLISGLARELANPTSVVRLNAQVLQNVWQDILVILSDHYTRKPSGLLGGLPYAEMRQLVPELIEDLSKSAQKIERAAENASDFSRPVAVGAFSDVDISVVVDQVQHLLRHVICQKTQEFSCDLQRNLPTLRLEKQKLEQTIATLLIASLETLSNKDCTFKVSTALNDTQSDLELRIQIQGDGVPVKQTDKLLKSISSKQQSIAEFMLDYDIVTTLLRDFGGTVRFSSESGKSAEILVRFVL